MISLVLALVQVYCVMFGYKGFIQRGDALFFAIALEIILEYGAWILLSELRRC